MLMIFLKINWPENTVWTIKTFPGGGTAISGGGTPNAGGGTAFWPVPAKFNRWINSDVVLESDSVLESDFDL